MSTEMRRGLLARLLGMPGTPVVSIGTTNEQSDGPSPLPVRNSRDGVVSASGQGVASQVLVLCPRCFSPRIGRASKMKVLGEKCDYAFWGHIGPLDKTRSEELGCYECGNLWPERYFDAPHIVRVVLPRPRG